MYELPLGMGLVPDLTQSAAVVAGDLTLLGAFWLAASAITFLVIIPLAARRSVETTAGRSEAELRQAA